MAITISGSGIVEANLADNAVTLAKMASGTDGEILTYDASGNPVAVSVGTDGQVLTSTGAGSPPAFEAAAGGLSPTWAVKMSANQTGLGDNTTTKVNFDTEVYDSDSTYDTTNKRFTVPSGQAGKYYIFTAFIMTTIDDSDIRTSNILIYKNGSLLSTLRTTASNSYHAGADGTAYANIYDLAVGDYIEVFAQINSYSGANTQYIDFYDSAIFGGFKIG